jgi:hypothetical protein
MINSRKMALEMFNSGCRIEERKERNRTVYYFTNYKDFEKTVAKKVVEALKADSILDHNLDYNPMVSIRKRQFEQYENALVRLKTIVSLERKPIYAIVAIPDPKLVNLTDFVVNLDYLTTKEFCHTHKVPEPTVHEGTEGLFRIDSIKHRFVVQYAKFLKKSITTDILVKTFGFLPQNERSNIYLPYVWDKYTIRTDQYGFWLNAYDGIDGRRVHTLGDLVDLGLVYKDKLIMV